jgi:hypothetical protein
MEDKDTHSILIVAEGEKEIAKVSSEYEELDHVQKLKVLFTIKNWVTDEFDKIANK